MGAHLFWRDAKACFDPLSSPNLPPDWSINTTINNIRNLARSFSSCNFVWVRRSCNAVAHATTKFALLSSNFLRFNKGNLPVVIESVHKKDYPAYLFCFLSFNIIAAYQKKKKILNPFKGQAQADSQKLLVLLLFCVYLLLFDCVYFLLQVSLYNSHNLSLGITNIVSISTL